MMLHTKLRGVPEDHGTTRHGRAHRPCQITFGGFRSSILYGTLLDQPVCAGLM